MQKRYINPEILKKLIENIFLKYNVPFEQATIAADLLVTADLRGVHSHGCSRLIEFYLPLIKNNLINFGTSPKSISKNGPFTHIDGKNGFGPYIGTYSMYNSINECKVNGFGITSVINSTHFGIASYYSLMAESENMIGIVVTNGSPAVAPNGGTESLIGTNALSVAFPYKPDFPILFDLAMSSTSLGNLYLKMKKGENVPSSWASSFLLRLNKFENKEHVDPKIIYENRMISPIGTVNGKGGNKGFEIALLLELILVIIFGGKYSFNQLVGEASQLFIAINPFLFISEEKYNYQISILKDKMSNIKMMDGYKNLSLPGEQSNLFFKERKLKGIPENLIMLPPIIKEAKNLNINYENLYM